MIPALALVVATGVTAVRADDKADVTKAPDRSDAHAAGIEARQERSLRSSLHRRRAEPDRSALLAGASTAKA